MGVPSSYVAMSVLHDSAINLPMISKEIEKTLKEGERLPHNHMKKVCNINVFLTVLSADYSHDLIESSASDQFFLRCCIGCYSREIHRYIK